MMTMMMAVARTAMTAMKLKRGTDVSQAGKEYFRQKQLGQRQGSGRDLEAAGKHLEGKQGVEADNKERIQFTQNCTCCSRL